MVSEDTVYDQSYQFYLDQIRDIDFNKIAPVLGAAVKAGRMIVTFFSEEYTVSGEGICGPSGEKPRYDTCVILSKYLLMCPGVEPAGEDGMSWVSFRNFKDSNPLIGYFKTSVEGAISSFFSGGLENLKKACRALGGVSPNLDVQYDYTVQFDVLPMVPVVLLFNDVDEEFPAQCILLFAARTESYLDAECIAMVGAQLFGHLKRVMG